MSPSSRRVPPLPSPPGSPMPRSAWRRPPPARAYECRGGAAPHVPDRIALDDRFRLRPADGRAEHSKPTRHDGHAGTRLLPPGHGLADDLGPQGRHPCSAMGSAVSALTLDRAELQVEGRQSWWAAIHRSSSSPTVRNGAARRTARYSANCVASSLRRSSASSSAPWNQNERWTVRPETGSTPTAIRISKTPGRRSRSDPWPHTPIRQK